MRTLLVLGVSSWVLASCSQLVAATPPPPAGPECPGVEERCGDVCTDTSQSPLDCGSCAHPCPQGSSCRDGLCSCPDRQVACDGACLDPLTSHEHCGAREGCQGDDAGQSCPMNRDCMEGVCGCDPARPLLCDGVCVDPTTSADHCGARGNCSGTAAGVACQGDQICQSGACVCDRSEHVLCGTSCIDPWTDATHCGATGNCLGAHAGSVCLLGQTCQMGKCRTLGAFLAKLEASPGSLTPAFEPGVTSYVYQSLGPEKALFLTEAPTDPTSVVTIEGTEMIPGVARQVPLKAATVLSITVSVAGAPATVYHITLLHPAILTGPPGSVGFGTSLALSGDTLAVGSSDAVSIYTLGGGAWTQEARLQAHGSIALSGDLLAVGGGGILIYRRHEGTWLLEYTADPDPGQAAGSLGAQVATDGGTVVASAPDEQWGPFSRGAVYVFHSSGGNWTREGAIRVCPDPKSTCLEGPSVGVSGNRLAIGGSSGAPYGYLFLLTGQDGMWSLDQLLQGGLTAELPSNTGATSLSMDGDEMATGDPVLRGPDGKPLDRAGRIHVLSRSTGTWLDEADLSEDDFVREDGLGQAVSLNGGRIAAGASGHDAGKGTVLLYSRGVSGWSRSMDIPGTDPAVRVGSSVALSGRNLAVSASLGSNARAVLVYTLP